MRKTILLVPVLGIIMLTAACGHKTDENSSTTNNSYQEYADINSAQYWVDKLEHPEELIMTEEEIELLNEEMLNTWGTDWYKGYYDVVNFPESMETDWLKERICYLDLKNSECYLKGEPVTREQWNHYYNNLNLDGITSEIKYAIVINNTSALDMPTEDILTDSEGDEAFNILQQTTYKMNEPVIVLHESNDGEWVYVVANEYIGWMKEEDCAYFSNRQEWLDYQEQEHFLMVCEDMSVPGLEKKFLMGTKIFLAESGEDAESETTDYVIQIPQRNDDGFVTCAYVGIVKNDALQEGYLPYTRKHVIELAFSELGEPYGWGGANGERDCSLFIKDIYACFGIRMPRNSRLQMNVPTGFEDMSVMSEDEKKKRISNACAGDVLGISGHVMLYLGETNGKHYVISMLSSYVPETVTENFSAAVENVSKVQVNSLNVRRRNGNTWMQELISVVSVQ